MIVAKSTDANARDFLKVVYKRCTKGFPRGTEVGEYDRQQGIIDTYSKGRPITSVALIVTGFLGGLFINPVGTFKNVIAEVAREKFGI